MKKLMIGFVTMMSVATTFGAGFGIYEASARGLAMGDAIVGDVDDATANYHNPANIADADSVQIALGGTLINPMYDIEINHVEQDRMNAGWFTIPHAYITIPLPGDFAFGLGEYTEYGAGTEYSYDWDARTDSISTTIEQFTLNPNLAYKVTDWWNISVGMRVSNFRFVQHGWVDEVGPLPAAMHSKVKGDDWGLGWNAAMSFKPTDKLSLGVVYRSSIKHKISGKHMLGGTVSAPVGVGGSLVALPVGSPMLDTVLAAQGAKLLPGGRASGVVRTPSSVVLGANYDFTERFRAGAAVTWTRWSNVKQINFNLPNGTEPLKLRWHNSWRVGLGMEYDFFDWMSGRIGYMYDRDPGSSHFLTTAIPPGDRHIICLGSGFRITDNLSLDLAYSFIRMNNEHGYLDDGKYASWRNGGSHIISATVKYEF